MSSFLFMVFCFENPFWAIITLLNTYKIRMKVDSIRLLELSLSDFSLVALQLNTSLHMFFTGYQVLFPSIITSKSSVFLQVTYTVILILFFLFFLAFFFYFQCPVIFYLSLITINHSSFFCFHQFLSLIISSL